MPLYFEVAKDYTPVGSGVAMFPLTFTVAPAAVAVGLIIAKTGRYRPSIVSPYNSHTNQQSLILFV
jgi:MFS family permease